MADCKEDVAVSDISGLHEIDYRTPQTVSLRRLVELLVDDVCRRPLEPLQDVAKGSASAVTIGAALQQTQVRLTPKQHDRVMAQVATYFGLE